jgi:hypothetical protein
MWAPVFFVSARRNPDVQFVLYTDLDVDTGGAANVTLHRMTIPDFNRRASEKLGTLIEVQHHLAKMSDLKPAYGLIFEEDLKAFPFWAYSDFDVVWGDIRRFITDELLHAHDIVSSRSDRLSGHFTLFRNTPEINRTFELIPDVYTAMGHHTHLHLDETVLSKYLKKAIGKWPLKTAARVYWKSDWTIDAKYQREMSDDDVMWFRDGRTFDVQGNEMMYLHFHKLKQHMQVINFGAGDSPSAFSIGRKGIVA